MFSFWILTNGVTIEHFRATVSGKTKQFCNFDFSRLHFWFYETKRTDLYRRCSASTPNRLNCSIGFRPNIFEWTEVFAKHVVALHDCFTIPSKPHLYHVYYTV